MIWRLRDVIKRPDFEKYTSMVKAILRNQGLRIERDDNNLRFLFFPFFFNHSFRLFSNDFDIWRNICIFDSEPIYY